MGVGFSRVPRPLEGPTTPSQQGEWHHKSFRPVWFQEGWSVEKQGEREPPKMEWKGSSAPRASTGPPHATRVTHTWASSRARDGGGEGLGVTRRPTAGMDSPGGAAATYGATCGRLVPGDQRSYQNVSGHEQPRPVAPVRKKIQQGSRRAELGLLSTLQGSGGQPGQRLAAASRTTI